MSWRPEMLIEGEWAGNAIRYASKEEAERDALALFSRWFAPEAWRVAESEEPANYRWPEGWRRPEPIEKGGG